MRIDIVGAGLSGLIAATQFKKASVFEAGPRKQMHKALLRFRSDSVSNATGIEFKKVKVSKGVIGCDGLFTTKPSFLDINSYSKKVTGKFSSRSISNLDPVERFIAPDDFYELLIEEIGENRINFNFHYSFSNNDHVVVSTIPMDVIIKEKEIAVSSDFSYASISVLNCIIEDCDLYQTLYFADLDNPVYRASITGSKLIIESVAEIDDIALLSTLSAFGIRARDVSDVKTASQRYGKISPINEKERRIVVSRLSTEHKIYSLGRFATWRNILLDDLIHDISVIKKLISSDEYSLRKQT